jgi:hypothetical protein
MFTEKINQQNSINITIQVSNANNNHNLFIILLLQHYIDCVFSCVFIHDLKKIIIGGRCLHKQLIINYEHNFQLKYLSYLYINKKNITLLQIKCSKTISLTSIKLFRNNN